MKTTHKFNIKKTFVLLVVFFGCIYLAQAANKNTPPHSYTFEYHNAKNFEILGQLPGAADYARLPFTAKDKVNNDLWNLSKYASGISVKFVTNSPAIRVRWAIKFNPAAHEMVLTGLRGADLYCNVNKKWQYVGTHKFEERSEDLTLVNSEDSTYKEYMLVLPVFDEITSAEIGIIEGFTIKEPDVKISKTPPIVIYGTSITQGGNASRPGTTYTSLLARALNKNVINLGFSSNGKFEKVFADLMLSAKPSVIILDCTPNSTPDEIKKNLPELIAAIRSKDEKIPILLIESIMRQDAYFKTDLMKTVLNQNATLKQIYNQLKGQGVKGLFYLSSEKLIGTDHEATTDGTHLNDLGHYRFYTELKNKLAEILK